jgi:hypothetical protein
MTVNNSPGERSMTQKDSKERFLTVLASGCMALIWRYAWANLITLATLHRPFPLPEAVMTFALAAIAAFISLSRGWRVIVVLTVQGVGLVFAAARVLYVFSNTAYHYWDRHWFSTFIAQPRDAMGWLFLALVIFWTIIFWVGGFLWQRRPRDHGTLCRQFDVGLAFFFLLFITKLLMWVKGGMRFADPLAEWLLVSFLLFSLLAIFLARNQHQVHREYVAGYKGIGVMLCFSLIILLVVGGSVSLGAPYLSQAAQVGYGLFKGVAAPLGSLMVAVLRLLFTPRAMRNDSSSSSSGSDAQNISAPYVDGASAGLFMEIMHYILITLAGVLILVVAALLVWFLVGWLLAKTRGSRKRGRWPRLGELFGMLAALWGDFVRLWQFMARMRRHKKAGVIELYAALQRWGVRSGVSPVASETPTEYGARLQYHFPALQRDVKAIVALFNRYVYGEITLRQREVASAEDAWRHMRSPRYWKQRLRIWFRYAG